MIHNNTVNDITTNYFRKIMNNFIFNKFGQFLNICFGLPNIVKGEQKLNGSQYVELNKKFLDSFY